jgi:hypothetical protein
VTVAGVVMAHERRGDWARDLSKQLDLPIVFDRVDDRHETGLRCIGAGLDSDATHWLIVQDDALVCRDLLAGVAEAVEVSQDRLVGLYVGNVRPQTGQVGEKVAAARAQGVSWLSMPGPWWGVGIVIPAVHLPDLYRHYWHSREQNYDRRIEKWAKAAGVECWYTNPSLVDHRTGEENPSLVAKRTGLNRCARWFIGADASALDVDWSLTPPPPPPSVVWRDTRTSRTVTAEAGTPRARQFDQSPRWERVEQAAVSA